MNDVPAVVTPNQETIREDPDVYGSIVSHLATEKVNEELRIASDRQRLKVHQRQRALVLASLLLSRRRDAPTHRRSVVGGG